MRSSRLSSFLALVLGLLRHPGLFDLLAQLGDFGRLLVAFAQFLLNVPKLLAQNMLALLGGERLLRLFADLPRKLQDFDALRKQRQHLVEGAP